MTRFALLALAAAIVAGCGGEQPPEPDEVPDTRAAVAALGDSITAGNPLYDPDPANREELGFGADPQSQYEYWAEESEPTLNFVNCGVFGERTDEIARRLADCTEGADVVIVQGGINDIAQVLGASPAVVEEAVSSAAANIEGMLAEAENRDLDAAVANVLPWNNGHPEADEAIEELNDRIAKMAVERGVTLLDFHKALEDPDEPGVMAPLYTDDGDHPSIEGYRILGELVATELAPPPEGSDP